MAYSFIEIDDIRDPHIFLARRVLLEALHDISAAERLERFQTSGMRDAAVGRAEDAVRWLDNHPRYMEFWCMAGGISPEAYRNEASRRINFIMGEMAPASFCPTSLCPTMDS